MNCEGTPSTSAAKAATAPEVSSQPLRGDRHDRRYEGWSDEKKRDREKFDIWKVEQYKSMMAMFNQDLNALKESEAFKEYLAEHDRMKKELIDKYN